MNILKATLLKSVLLTLRNSIVIETSKTPNPNFLKFTPVNHQVLGNLGTLDISSKEHSAISPLAEQLFEIKGIKRVFYASNYLSISKDENSEWDELKPEIFRIINEHYQTKQSILVRDAILDAEDIDQNDTEVVQFIKEIIAARIRPNVQQDGGDVKFIAFDQEKGVVTLKMEGACSGCPSSAATLKGGIEKMLTYYIPEVKSVLQLQE